MKDMVEKHQQKVLVDAIRLATLILREQRDHMEKLIKKEDVPQYQIEFIRAALVFLREMDIIIDDIEGMAKDEDKCPQ